MVEVFVMIRGWSVADLDQKFWGNQNNILKIYIFNIIVTDSMKMNNTLAYL